MTDQATQVVLQVPKDIINAQVKAAVLASLTGGNAEKFVHTLVQVVMNEKDRNNYNNKTIFDTAIETMILDLTRECAKEYVENLRPQLKVEIEQRMGIGLGKTRRQAASTFAEKVVDALVANLTVQINVGTPSPKY